MDIQIIENTIDELEHSDISMNNAIELASLYIIRNNNLTGINKEETGGIRGEIEDILPAYIEYRQVKTQYQLIDTLTMLKHRGFLPSLLSYDSLIRNGLANSPLDSFSQVKFCLPFLIMLYAPFTSVFNNVPFLDWYKPLFTLLPLNPFV